MNNSWEDEFKIGIETIDEQHKQLFDKMDSLTLTLYNGKAASIVQDLIVFLTEYTNFHFNHEEDLMITYKDDDLTRHVD